MTIKEIQYIVTIVQEGSYSKAAEKLFISQSALSQAIQKLEDRLGFQLLYRNRRNITPTPAGKTFIDSGMEVLQANQHMEETISKINSNKTETINFGISLFYSYHHLTRFLPAFQHSYPNVKINIREENSATLEHLVDTGELDLALVPFPLELQLEYEILYREEIFLAMPENHPLAVLYHNSGVSAFPYIDLCKVKNEPFISLYKMRFTNQEHLIFSEFGIKPKVRFETRNWDTAHEFIRQGLGIGFIPEILIPDHRTANDPVYFRIKSENAFRPYVAIYKNRDQLSDVTLRFIEVAQALFIQKTSN